MDHEMLHKQALMAIHKLFFDDSVKESETRKSLINLKFEIDVCINALMVDESA